jgi:hypothetical protein
VNSNDNTQDNYPRNYAVKDFLKNKRHEITSNLINNNDDRGKNTLFAGYTGLDELEKILCAGFTRHNTTKGLRNTAAFALSHLLLLRGDNIRNIDLSCMFTVTLPGESFNNDRPAKALVITLLRSKTNDEGRKDYSAALRHVQVECCAIAWVSLFLLGRWDVDEEDFPNFSESQHWFRLKVISDLQLCCASL